MFIIHRITIQRYIRYNLGFGLFYSMLLFPGKCDISPRNYVLTKPWSSEFWFGGIDKNFLFIHNTSDRDIGNGFAKYEERYKLGYMCPVSY